MGLIPRGCVLHPCIADALELSFGVKVGHSLNVASWELFFAARFKLNDFVEKKSCQKVVPAKCQQMLSFAAQNMSEKLGSMGN